MISSGIFHNSSMSLSNANYSQWLNELKRKIRSAQIRTALAANASLIEFYWELGKMIAEKQTEWGSKFLETLSGDLRSEFPDMQGFSVTNLKYCRLFYSYFEISPQSGDEILISSQIEDEIDTSIHEAESRQHQLMLQQSQTFNLVKLIPWGHIKVIIAKVKNRDEAVFYIAKSIEDSWSRDTLALMIKSNLYERSGRGVSNFKHTLPQHESELAQQTLKDPYIFDFMTLSETAKEADIEKQLVQHITKFLLELGKGFAFIGRQHHLEVGGNDYFLDLLFYHTRLKCYVVIELKNTRFIPEYAGKLNFYLSAVDSLLKQPDDKPTIGILLCREKNNVEAEFALRDINKPMGVSEFQITENLPDELKSSLPTIAEIENELRKLEDA